MPEEFASQLAREITLEDDLHVSRIQLVAE
jgi:hypothetical protein